MPEMSTAEIRSICERVGNAPTPPTTAAGQTATDPQNDIDASVEASGLVLPSNLLLRLQAALRQGNVRLIGPPGTGKSTLAKALLESAVGDDGYVFAVATGQWTGEDIIGGPTPDPANPTTLVFKPGMVLQAAEEQKWVGIDEMNRADIDAAFGELFGLLAGFDLELPYQLSPESTARVVIYADRPEGELPEGAFGLPAGWRMVATMNSWDKLSLNRVSFAFSRRWCTVFVPVPEPDDYKSILDGMQARYHPGLEDTTRSALDFLFVDATDGESKTLRELGFAMGPGIAKSIIRDIASMAALGIDEGEALAHALDGFLLPQFEGALEHHDDLRDCLARALVKASAPQVALDASEAKLAVFTGQRLSTSY